MLYFTVDNSPMVSLSYRTLIQGIMSWVAGEQWRESQVRAEANRLAEQGCTEIHWENI